ncbi:hypothetical protein D3C71_2176480 [compost metagenome]
MALSRDVARRRYAASSSLVRVSVAESAISSSAESGIASWMDMSWSLNSESAQPRVLMARWRSPLSFSSK